MKEEVTRHIHVPPLGRAEPPLVESDESLERTVLLPAGGIEPKGSTNMDGVADLYSLYAVQGKIGDGGMGVVYLAKDRRLGRHVAIKRLNSQARNSQSLRARFLNEARAVAALNHIHIVHIYALGEDAEGPYIVMEYVPGPNAAGSSRQSAAAQPNPPLSLDAQVGHNGQYTVNEAIDLLVKISKAIAYAHDRGVIHRDLKPTNILLDTSGEPKIVDFGLARLLSEEENKLTVPGEKLLSLGYGAPEQESDASLSDERADVYGLGALLYFAITGQNPRYFREQDIPVALRETLVKALATDREQRWESVAKLLEALQAVQSRTRIETPPAKTTWRCKWCDTVNPLTIRFCSECGWDGNENCPECGQGSFVGVQYCGNCGADARAYEGIATLLRRMRGALENGEFERVAALAGRAHGFEPAGASGRSLARQIQELASQAQKQTARREQLKGLIPMEMRAENFERARDFIAEYRKLSGQPNLMAEEESQIAPLMVKRDLRRARQAMRNREWEHALALCDTLLHGVAPDNPDCLALRHAIVTRKLRQRSAILALSLCAFFLLYILSLPLLLHGNSKKAPRRTFRILYHPARWFYDSSGLSRPLSFYARLCGIRDLTGRFYGDTKPVKTERSEPGELIAQRQSYLEQLRTIEAEHKRYLKAWPQEYSDALGKLMELRQTAGDFEAWRSLNSEQQRFKDAGVIGTNLEDEPSELQALKRRYRAQIAAAAIDHARSLVAACKKYVNDLNDLMRNYTKNGRLDDADSVSSAIQNARSAPDYIAAETLLADSSGALTEEVVASLPPARVTEESLSELQPLREQYGKYLVTIELEHAQKVEQWPEKYLATLQNLMERYQANGDYLGWQAVKSEQTRFEIDRVLQATDVANDLPKLAETQQQNIALLASYRTARARAIVNLAERQIKILGDMQRKFTIAGKMEDAGEVNSEIRRLRTTPEVLAAQAELAPSPAPAITNGVSPGKNL